MRPGGGTSYPGPGGSVLPLLSVVGQFGYLLGSTVCHFLGDFSEATIGVERQSYVLAQELVLSRKQLLRSATLRQSRQCGPSRLKLSLSPVEVFLGEILVSLGCRATALLEHLHAAIVPLNSLLGVATHAEYLRKLLC